MAQTDSELEQVREIMHEALDTVHDEYVARQKKGETGEAEVLPELLVGQRFVVEGVPCEVTWIRGEDWNDYAAILRPIADLERERM